jgi:hypothetical protein
MSDFNNLKQRLLRASVAPEDALKYAAAKLYEITGWALDSIGGSFCDHEGHETELNAIHDVVDEIRDLARQFGDPNRYSDGRVVKSSAAIEHGIYTEHVWHPDPTAEQPRSWSGHLHSDPGVPSPGVYEVSTAPSTQGVHVRVVRAVD